MKDQINLLAIIISVGTHSLKKIVPATSYCWECTENKGTYFYKSSPLFLLYFASPVVVVLINIILSQGVPVLSCNPLKELEHRDTDI